MTFLCKTQRSGPSQLQGTASNVTGASSQSSVSIMGSTHQGDERYGKFAGTQCTAIAFLAILFAASFPINRWTPQDIDTILAEGSNLHAQIIDSMSYMSTVPLFLLHSELPSALDLGNGVMFNSEIVLDELFGIVGLSPNQRDEDACIGTSIDQALQIGFALAPTLLTTFSESTIAIFSLGDSYAIFDSHSRNNMGRPIPNGAAVVIRFSSFDCLQSYIEEQYSGLSFDVSPVTANAMLSPESVAESDSCRALHNFASVEEMLSGSMTGNFEHVNDSAMLTTTVCSNLDVCLNHTYATKCSNFSVDKSIHLAASDHATDVCLNHTYATKFDDLSNLTENCTSESTSGQTPGELASHSHESNLILDQIPYIIVQETDIFSPGIAGTSRVKDVSSGSPVQTQICNVTSLSAVQNDPRVCLKFKHYISELPDVSCTVCHKIGYRTKMKLLEAVNDLTIKLGIAKKCLVCSSCYSKCTKCSIPCQAFHWNKLDPGSIPTFLQNLWVVEKRLISLNQVFLTLITLPGGQLSLHGIAINMPVDLNSQTEAFFSGICKYQSLVKVICDRPNKDPSIVLARPQAVKNAINWLMDNNLLYHNFNVSYSWMTDSSLNHQLEDGCDQLEDVIQEECGACQSDYASNMCSELTQNSSPVVIT